MLLCMVMMVLLCLAFAKMASALQRAQVQESLPQKSRPKMDALDGLRTVLVTYTILHHQAAWMPWWLHAVFRVGHWSMQFFFVLSGFVLFYVAEGKLSSYNRCAGFALAARRLARLLPAYFIALLWLYALAYFRIVAGMPFLAWPLQALCVQTLLPVKVCGPIEVDPRWDGANYMHFAANYVGWFTSAVVLLSLCFPLLFNGTRGWGARSTYALLASVVILRSVPTLLHEQLPTRGEGLDLYVFAPLRLLEFLAGMLSAQLCSTMTSSTLAWTGWGWVFDVALAVGVMWPFAAPSAEPPHGDFFLVAVFCLACIAARGAVEAAQGGVVSGLLGPALSSGVLVWLAERSFAAYILQVPVRYSLPNSWMVHAWPLHCVITWLVGLLCCAVVEKPIRDAMETLLVKK
jgi:peptidoglycan/LPS O-acetylase OafA/YrhL